MGNLLLDIYIYFFFAAKSICNFLYISYIYSLIFSILPPIVSIFIKSKSKLSFLEDFLNFTLPTFICLYAHSHTHTQIFCYTILISKSSVLFCITITLLLSLLYTAIEKEQNTVSSLISDVIVIFKFSSVLCTDSEILLTIFAIFFSKHSPNIYS